MYVSLVDSVGSVCESRFRAMGSDIHLILVGAPDAWLDVAAARIEDLEGKWSRFRTGSEVSAINRSAGAPVIVSADTRLLVSLAIDAWRMTGGGFDPTLLADIVRAGYDRSFADLDRDRAGTEETVSRVHLHLSTPDCTDIVVGDRTVMIPAGIGFDPGGIGKGLAADLVAREMMDLGVKGACINIGGDVRVAGSSPSGGGWTLAIEHPWCSRPIALVGLQGGAVATSSVLGRTWSVGGNARHHLIDPSTREPSHSDLALASVVAGEAWEAEVYAKAVLLRGSGRAFDLLDDAVQALTVDHSGLVASTTGLQAFFGEAGVASQVAFDIEHPTQTMGDRHE